MALNKIIRFSIFIIICVATLFVPLQMTMAPERQIQITTDDKSPIEGARVRQIWHQYSLEERGQEDLIVPANGKVLLTERVVKTNVYALIWGAFNKFYQYGIHAGYSSSESIGIIATGYNDKWFHDGKGLDKGLVVLTRKN